jgi:hypothetical protein
MAGEWIKLEAATIEKPEIFRIARLLGVSQLHVVGMLIRFWIWLDKNSVDGRVDGVESQDVDDLMSCPGLSAALKDVKWLHVDDKARVLTVPNFDRHNGETAKKRALKNERQARWRAKTVDAPPSTRASTREEKRRDISTNVDIDAPSEEHRSLADQLGVSCQAEWLKYRDWLAASGRKHRDSSAGFRNWLRKAAEFKPRIVPAKQDARTVAASAIFGDANGKRPDDAIDGTAERVA